MKLKIDRSLLIKIGYLLILIAIAPFAMEVLFIADVVGVEFAVTFMLLYFKTAYFELIERWWRFKAELNEQVTHFAELLMFQPRSYGLSSMTTCLVMVLSGSTLVAITVWIPAMVMSSGYIV